MFLSLLPLPSPLSEINEHVLGEGGKRPECFELRSRNSACEINCFCSPLFFLLPTGERQAKPTAAPRAKSLSLSFHVSTLASRKIFPVSEGRGHAEGCCGPLVASPADRQCGAAGGAPQRGSFLWKLAVSSPLSWPGASGVLSKCLGNLPVGSHSGFRDPGITRALGGHQRLIGR